MSKNVGNLILVFILLIISSLMVVYVFGFFSGNKRIVEFIVSLPPIIISLGILVAIIGLKDNRKFNELRISREESVIIFKECERKFNEADNFVNGVQSASYDYLPGIHSSALDNVKEIADIFHDLSSLYGSLKHDTFISSYMIRCNDIRRDIYSEFNRQTTLSITKLRYGDNANSIEEKIDASNDQRSKLIQEERVDVYGFFSKRDDRTPFPDGPSVSSLEDIIRFFAEPRGDMNYNHRSFRTEINEPELLTIKEYIELCKKVDNVNGALIFIE